MEMVVSVLEILYIMTKGLYTVGYHEILYWNACVSFEKAYNWVHYEEILYMMR